MKSNKLTSKQKKIADNKTMSFSFRHITFLIALFTLPSFSLLSAPPQTVSVGFVEKVYVIENKIIIALQNQELFYEYLKEYPQQNEWRLSDNQNRVMGTFVRERQETSNGVLLLHGRMREQNASVYAGLQIHLLLTPMPEPKLPDSFQNQSLLKTNITNAIDQSRMVLIPAGPFLYGSQNLNTLHYTSEVSGEEKSSNRFMQTVRYQEASAFYIDRYEITNAQFAKFLQATASPPPPNFDFQKNPHQPITNASFTQAENYCRWAEKRLPTELEWEKAARGGVQKILNIHEQVEFLPADRIYPTGSSFDEQVCNTRESGYGAPLDVYSLRDESPYQVVGMCGNAAEWTSSWLLPYRGNVTPNALFGRKYKVIRGGSFQDDKTWARTYERRAGGIPTLQLDFRAGFRCAKSVE